MKPIFTLLSGICLLAACAGGGTRDSNGSARSDTVLALPTLEDPQLASKLQRLIPEYRRWLSSPATYLTTLPQPQSWPCSVTQADQAKLGGVPEKPDAKYMAAWSKAERDSGMKKGSIKPNTIEDAKVNFLRGACSNGKLSGDIELLTEYVSVQSSSLGNETRSPVKVLRRFKAVNGQQVGETFNAIFQGKGQESKPINPGIKLDLLAGTFTLSDSQPYQRSVSISYMRTESPKPLLGSYVDVTQSVSVSQPIRGDRWKTTTYNGATKTYEMLYKGDKMHGKSRSFAWSKMSPYSPAPLIFPAGETCYDEGELIKSVSCDVN